MYAPNSTERLQRGMEPQMNTDDLTETIIGCAMKVSNTLGVGFLEKVYENALAVELRKAGLVPEQQKKISVTYDGVIVGDYSADILVNGQVILELKAVKFIDEIHKAQLLNYLKATGLRVGLILNFGTPKLGIKRMVL
jgi:GxxExxY protein